MMYNLSYLREISGGDEEFVRNILREFITHAPGILKQIQEASLRSDWSAVRSIIHQFAPRLDFVGMNETRFLADRLEEIVKNSPDPAMVKEIAARISADCEIVIENLKTDFQL